MLVATVMAKSHRAPKKVHLIPLLLPPLDQSKTRRIRKTPAFSMLVLPVHLIKEKINKDKTPNPPRREPRLLDSEWTIQSRGPGNPNLGGNRPNPTGTLLQCSGRSCLPIR
jgi:hypothetical protein